MGLLLGATQGWAGAMEEGEVALHAKWGETGHPLLLLLVLAHH